MNASLDSSMKASLPQIDSAWRTPVLSAGILRVWASGAGPVAVLDRRRAVHLQLLLRGGPAAGLRRVLRAAVRRERTGAYYCLCLRHRKTMPLDIHFMLCATRCNFPTT